MPIFISYSHADRGFVDQLAHQLVYHKVNVWLDRWELHVGDSLIAKIQEAISDASALLVILSKSSVQSEWCKKELNSGLIRELEERRVVVLPVLSEDCEIPLFLREKLYADFRTDFDDGLNTILEAVAKVTNEWMNRIDTPDWHTDWSIDWGDIGGELLGIRLTLVEVSKSQPYTVLTVVEMIGDDNATQWYKVMAENSAGESARRQIVEAFSAELTRLDLRTTLDDQFPLSNTVPFSLEYGEFVAHISTRRLGMDTGRDIVFDTANQIRGITKQMRQAAAQPPNDA